MTSILAHLANLSGPDPATENSLAATQAALELGFGLETDLRRDSHSSITHTPPRLSPLLFTIYGAPRLGSIK